MESVLARFDAAVDDLMTLRLDALTGDDLVALASRLETSKRRLPVVDHRLIAQAQTRNLDFAHGAKNLADFLKQSSASPAAKHRPESGPRKPPARAPR